MIEKTRALGIDYGKKKIGLALSSGGIVSPLPVLDNRFGHKIGEVAIRQIAEIVRDERVSVIVVGIPMMNGVEDGIASEIRIFTHKLRKQIPSNIDVKFVDESYTSKMAGTKAVEFDISKKRRKNDHAIAACEILKRGLGC